jgi:hypothetical protein
MKEEELIKKLEKVELPWIELQSHRRRLRIAVLNADHLLNEQPRVTTSALAKSKREGLCQVLRMRAKRVEPISQSWNGIRRRIESRSSFRERINGILSRPAWRTAIPVMLVAIAIGVLWGSGIIPRSSPTITFAPGPSGSASYVSSFLDMGELCNSSDVIVVGTVNRVIDVVPNEWGDGMIYDARSAFRIDRVLKGKIDKEIILTKMAFKGQGVWVEGMAEDPPFEAGERWVLFLNADMSYNNLGPWGRYKIIDDKVYSMNRIMGDNNVYGAGQPDFKLDFNGVDLSDFIASVNETLDSVVLTFTDSRIAWAIDTAVRFDAGSFQEVNVNLSTGKYGPDSLTYTVKRVKSEDSVAEIPMPAGLDVTVEPAQFTAYPRNQYRSTLKVQTTPDLPPATYWIRVGYQFGEAISGYRVLMVNINPLETVGPD